MYQRERNKHLANPQGSLEDGVRRFRDLFGQGPHEPTRFNQLLGEVLWGMFNTAKRCYSVLAAVAAALESGNGGLARGTCMPGMRWLVLSVQAPKDPQLAWKLTFLQDPVPIVSPQKVGTGIDINNSVLDPSQLTAVIGLSKDLELLQKRLGMDSRTDDRPKGDPNKGTPPQRGQMGASPKQARQRPSRASPATKFISGWFPGASGERAQA